MAHEPTEGAGGLMTEGSTAGGGPMPPDDPPGGGDQARALHRRPRTVTALLAGAAGLAVLATVTYAVVAGDGGSPPGSTTTEEPLVVDPLEGTFVGRAGQLSVAVVAAPWAEGDSARLVTVYVTDGRSVSEWFETSTPRNAVRAESSDGDVRLTADLGRSSVAGTVELEGGRTVSLEAERAGGASGLYNVSVDDRGRLTGTTPQGVGVSGRLTDSGNGTLVLADGRNLSVEADRGRSGTDGLERGQMRLVVDAQGDVAGVLRTDGDAFWLTGGR